MNLWLRLLHLIAASCLRPRLDPRAGRWTGTLDANQALEIVMQSGLGATIRHGIGQS
jgi:hypothetical protein